LAVVRVDNRVGARMALTMLRVDARLLTLVDVAEVLNTSRSQVYALVRGTHLAAARIGGRGQWRVSRQDLQTYLDKTYTETSDWIDNHPYGSPVTDP
jgi:excisionase family DNA binding protein